MRHGRPDPLERMSDARRIGVERVLVGENSKGLGMEVIAAEAPATR